ncbi:MAG: hypothetical protein ACT4OJ_04960 [Bacteroidota bacterium]
MTEQHFTPYKEVIIRSINSCTATEQLWCCHDMIDRFKECFFNFTGLRQALEQAAEELTAHYLQKHHELHIY